jgi:uncharacterized Zn-finger protein
MRIIQPPHRQEREPIMSQFQAETFEVEDVQVACDGGGGPLGHPKVYLNLEKEGHVECPYCSRRYVLKAGSHAMAGH